MNLVEMIQAEIDKTQAKLARAGLQPFHIPFRLVEGMKKAQTIAIAYRAGHIEFNLNYFQFPKDIPFAQLVAHEVAHLYQFKYYNYPGVQGHGREFRMIMKFLGFSGNAKVDTTGEAKAYYEATVKAATRKPKTKTRHVYLSADTKQEVFLTTQQHRKEQAHIQVHGRGRFTFKGQRLVATGKVRKFV
jgi:predicted SprT family Zn-dependent metalloprotease